MANDEHLAVLRQGVDAWNAWRNERRAEAITKEEDEQRSDLSGADLRAAFLCEADLSGADLRAANLHSPKRRHNIIEGPAPGHLVGLGINGVMVSPAKPAGSATRLHISADFQRNEVGFRAWT